MSPVKLVLLALAAGLVAGCSHMYVAGDVGGGAAQVEPPRR